MATATDAPERTRSDPRTLRWWTLLRGIAIFNVLAWAATFLSVDDTLGSVRIHLALSAIYVAVCAFRSFLPRIDLERTVMVDHWASSMVAGRSAATVAELCFAIQVALLVKLVGEAAGLPALVGPLPIAIVAALALAQVFCWVGVVTLSHLGHAIEEALWALTFTAIGVAMAAALPHLGGPLKGAALVALPGCVGYVAFMVLVDVPMYLRRWLAHRAEGGATLGLVEGFQDALHRREPTRSWAVWRPEVAWLTGYFSFAVWASLGFVHLAQFSGPVQGG